MLRARAYAFKWFKCTLLDESQDTRPEQASHQRSQLSYMLKALDTIVKKTWCPYLLHDQSLSKH